MTKLTLAKDIIDDDFRLLLKGLQDISEEAGSERLEKGEWGSASFGLYLKAFYHFSTMSYVAQGVKVPYLGLQFEDPGSLPVLLRAAWESVLTFSYVFADPPSESEGILRYAVWRLYGLLSRQKCEAISKWGQKVKDNDLELILDLQNEIRVHNLFHSFKNGEQNKIITKGEWRLPILKENNERGIPSWNDIALDAGLSKKTACETYNYLSCYAHSSYWSVFQIVQADTSESKRMLIDGALSTSKVAMALLGCKYAKIFPKGENVFKRNHVIAELFDTWRNIGSQEADDMDIKWDEEFGEEV